MALHRIRHSKKLRTHKLNTWFDNLGFCSYCQQKTHYSRWDLDHVIPFSKSKDNSKDNLIGCCKTCNNKKGAISLLAFLNGKHTWTKKLRKSFDNPVIPANLTV